MTRRYYITGGNNVGDPAVGDTSITDTFFDGKRITGVFKEGFRYLVPSYEYEVVGDTVKVTNGSDFRGGEVFVVEVGPRRTGTTCPAGGVEDSETDPYLPDILKCVVARVNSIFELRDDDPFSVHYDRGLYQQVGNDRLIDNSGFIMIWLVMPFIEDGALDRSYYADATCELFIATPTEANYSQQQREDINFYPRLIPVFHELIKEIKNEPKLNRPKIVRHTRTLLPYWGGGDVMGPGQPNLWKNYADCIKISGLKLRIENIKNCIVLKSF